MLRMKCTRHRCQVALNTWAIAGGDRHHPSALARLEVRGIEPEISPLARDRAVEEALHALVDLLAESRHLRLRDAAHAHGLDEVLDLAGRDALDPGLLDHGDERPLGGLARLQEGRE